MKLRHPALTSFLLMLAVLSFLTQAPVLFADPQKQQQILTASEAYAESSLEKTEQILDNLDLADQKMDETRIRLRRKGKDV